MGKIDSNSDLADLAVWDQAIIYSKDILQRHGNILSQFQINALHYLLGSFVYAIAEPYKRRRQVFPLPCGAGKTTAVRGFIRAVHELGRDYRIVVCAEKVEGLCQLKRDLIGEDGISQDKISLLHSYEHNPNFDIENPEPGVASEPSDSAELGYLRQFVLMTHQKLHGGFNKMDYDLLIYDESLVLGKGTVFKFEDLFGAIGKFSGAVSGKGTGASKEQRSLSSWLGTVNESIAEARDGEVLKFSDLPVDIGIARKLDQPINKQDQTLRTFMGLVSDGVDLRVMAEANQGSSIISIEQTIPDDLTNFAVLDASYPIRALMTYDQTITNSDFPLDIKDHSDVTIHLAKTKAGRRHIMQTLASNDDPKLFDEVASIAAEKLAKGDKVLIFTFKDDGNKRPSERLKSLIKVHQKNQPAHPDAQLHFLTWGYETALNRFSQCDVVIFAGLLTLPTAEVAARTCAHARDIELSLSSEELGKLVQSEKIHSIYQALNRGRCRIMTNGKAGKMDAYVFTHDYKEVRISLEHAMPKVKFKDHKAKHLSGKETKKDKCKAAFLDHLQRYQGDKISTKKLYAIVTDASLDTKRVAMDELMDNELTFDWKKESKSLIRII